MPQLTQYVSPTECLFLIQNAKEEDMGHHGIDLTSQTFIEPDRIGKATFHARKPGKLCGAALLEWIARIYDPTLEVDVLMHDGDTLEKGSAIATVNGPLQSILSFERIALNFLTHLSGIASTTWQYVQLTQGTKAGIYDTRKTIPGLRSLAKYAVVCGGGMNHRIGLYDAILIKDNHIAHIPLEQLSDALKASFTKVRQAPKPPAFIEVEVDTLDQLKRVLDCGVDMVLLDNMDCDTLKQAVAIRDELAPTVELEASGGVDLTTVKAIAQTGVDRIAIGAVTHSAPALDIGLDIAP
jgi:nicotinate-nucleotide pyrophosphorylase (carboxylating)